MSLTGLASPEEDAAYLASSLTELLDSEWIPQPVHASIGAEVGRLYIATRASGTDDLNGVLVDLGTGLSAFDMGDCFEALGTWLTPRRTF